LYSVAEARIVDGLEKIVQGMNFKSAQSVLLVR
jgi:hypothetical protein